MKKLIMLVMLLVPLHAEAESSAKCRGKFADWFIDCVKQCNKTATDDESLVACRSQCSAELKEKIDDCVAK